VASNEFKHDVRQIPFYQSEIISKTIRMAALIDSAADYFLTQSTQQDRANLAEMYERDLQYFDKFLLDDDTATMLGLLAARSLIQFYIADLYKRLQFLMRPTDTERSIFWTAVSKSQTVPDTRMREDLLRRRHDTVIMILDEENRKFEEMIDQIFLQFRKFQLNLTGRKNTSTPSVFDLVDIQIIKKKHLFYEAIYKKSTKTAYSDVPYIYELKNPEKSDAHCGAAGLERSSLQQSML
jgi:hypothetical protein